MKTKKVKGSTVRFRGHCGAVVEFKSQQASGHRCVSRLWFSRAVMRSPLLSFEDEPLINVILSQKDPSTCDKINY